MDAFLTLNIVNKGLGYIHGTGKLFLTEAQRFSFGADVETIIFHDNPFLKNSLKLLAKIFLLL